MSDLSRFGDTGDEPLVFYRFEQLSEAELRILLARLEKEEERLRQKERK